MPWNTGPQLSEECLDLGLITLAGLLISAEARTLSVLEAAVVREPALQVKIHEK